ncbi:MAG TPA: ComF family protein [Paracoccaceae bacterium]|nr:ComF family protein [Paracoccaceae bacterium]
MQAREIARQLVDLIYPPRCIACREPTETAHALCAACWRDANFIAGAICDACGAPVVDALGAAGPIHCEDCTQRPPAWDRGRAALLYEGAGRRMVLALKHGDRLDLVPPLASWMARAGADLLADVGLVAPVPLHWLRLARRRFNQSAELARAIARRQGPELAADLLIRTRATPSQEGRNRADRIANLAGAFEVHWRWRARIAGARLLLVDDVMTTGATLSACAETCRAAGAASVMVLVAARVTRAP